MIPNPDLRRGGRWTALLVSFFTALAIGACAGELPRGDGGAPVTSNEAGSELGASADLFICSLAADGASCSEGDVCSWSDGCDAGRCECENNALFCIVTSTCDDGGTSEDTGGTSEDSAAPTNCPSPQEARCATSCTGDLRDCVCLSGSSNERPCDCIDGAWRC